VLRHTTPARYAEIAAARFNSVIGGNGVTSDPTPNDPADLHKRALDAADANNLRFLITESILKNAIGGEIPPDRREAVTKKGITIDDAAITKEVRHLPSPIHPPS
jgi:hypothetical protein